MKNRFLSLLCVLALCLGLLPVTALAAAPIGQVLYVGGVQISSTGYWTTDSDGNVTASTAGETPTDNYISYDAENNVLTLHNATIKNELEFNESIEGGTFISGSAIGVFNKSGNAELTISLVGTNTIANVGKGIFVLASSASTGSSNLTIQGDGSLNASASQTGIWVQSNGNNAALCVENAEVTASPDGAVKNGVLVQAKDGSDVSLTVNGGSLTASVNANIWFQFGSGVSGSGTPTVTVSNNAIVRANGGIANTSSTSIQYETGSDSTGGIVFDGNTGTVYGDVELQEDLEIGEGESLTIGQDASLTVPSGTTLTNNGTVTTTDGGSLTNQGTINNSGTLPDSIEGSQPPKITTTSPLPDGTVGTVYRQSFAATGIDTITWSSSDLPNWLTLNSGTITGTPTAAGASTFTVTATNDSGSDNKVYTLTIKSVPVASVSLNESNLSLYTGKTATLTATVTPENATNKAVTWESSNPDVATVTDGTVTAVKEGTATITATAADSSGVFATCTVTVIQSEYSISADTTALDFGSVYTGYTQPAAKIVTITNTGNQSLTLNQPASTSSFEVGTLTDTELAAGEKATFTVQPKAGLAVGTYSENITVSGSEGATVTIPAGFTVEQRDNTPYYGIAVNDLANGTVTCYAKSAAKGAEVTLTVKPDVGYALDKLTVTDASGKTVDVTKVDEKTYTFVMPGRAVTVEAVFAPSTSGLPFTDVSAGDWFYEAVQFVYENGLMDGVAGNLFAPNATLNRAMAVTILYRLEGSPDLDGENLGYPFADVDGDTWYSDAVYWARLNGIVDGVENNHFDPTGSLTREQMATILYRYAQYKGADVSASGDISGFVDSANVSDWAVDAVKWAVGSGLVNGVEGNALAPQGTSTRAQAAAVLMRLSQAMGG